MQSRIKTCGWLIIGMAGIGSAWAILRSEGQGVERVTEARPGPKAAPSVAARGSGQKDPSPLVKLVAEKEAEIARLRARIATLERERPLRRARSSALAAGRAPEGPPAPTGRLEEMRVKLDALTRAGSLPTDTRLHALLGELRNLGAAALPLLGEVLLHGRTNAERSWAAAALEELGDGSELPFLERSLLEEQDLEVRRRAVRTLAEGERAEARPALDRALQDPDRTVRMVAARGLASQGDARGVEELVRWYESPDVDPMTRLSILGGIGEVGHPAARPLLQRILLDSRDPASLTIAIRGVERSGDRSLLADVQRVAATAQDGGVREAAERAVRALRG